MYVPEEPPPPSNWLITSVPPCAGLGLAVAVAVIVDVAVAVFVGVGVLVRVAVPASVDVGVGLGPPTQVTAADAVLRGIGPVMMSKSLLLLSVSWQPLFFRTFPCVLTSEAPPLVAAPPSALFAVPYATRSIMSALGSVQGVAVAPQTFGWKAAVTSATLPFVAERLRFVVVSSGVTGNGLPPDPGIPS